MDVRESVVVYTTIMHYLNGDWVEEKDLKISAFDLSVIRGFGVFDFLRTYNRKPFLLEPHIDRFFNSAKELGIVLPKSKEEIAAIVAEGIAKNSLSDFNIRMVATGGVGPDGVTPGTPSLIVMFTEAHDYPAHFYEKGVKVITYPHLRTFPTAKTLNYLAAIVALQMARNNDAIEAVYTDNALRILEGTTSNFFAVLNGRLVTPKNDILIGITRGVVLELAHELGVTVEEREISTSEIPTFQEAFITASNKEVMPVVMIDEVTIGDGVVGQITQSIRKRYTAVSREKLAATTS